MLTEERPVIYIVDDDASIRASLSILLEVHGLRSEAFPSPGHFLQHADMSRRYCLIVDARLPGMSGLELLGKLNSHQQTVPSFMITGHGDVDLLEAARQQGVTECFRKPFNCDALVSSVQRVLEELEETA